MEAFITKGKEFLLQALENLGLALSEIREQFIGDKPDNAKSKETTKFISHNLKIVDSLCKLIKGCAIFAAFEKAPESVEDEGLPYPKEYANALAGMKPSDFEFLKSLGMSIPGLVGGEVGK